MQKAVRLVVLGLSVMAAAFATAQEGVYYGSVAGRVTDTQGAAVPGADVTARQLQTNVKTAAVTDPDGRFRFAFLRMGPYELTVAKQGFKAASRSLALNAGGAYQVPIALELGQLAESLTVQGEAVVLETARSQIAGTVSAVEASALPMSNGRRLAGARGDLALSSSNFEFFNPGFRMRRREGLK